MDGCPVREDDVLELGLTAAAWLAAGAGNPDLMLAGLILRSRPSRSRVRDYAVDEEG